MKPSSLCWSGFKSDALFAVFALAVGLAAPIATLNASSSPLESGTPAPTPASTPAQTRPSVKWTLVAPEANPNDIGDGTEIETKTLPFSNDTRTRFLGIATANPEIPDDFETRLINLFTRATGAQFPPGTKVVLGKDESITVTNTRDNLNRVEHFLQKYDLIKQIELHVNLVTVPAEAAGIFSQETKYYPDGIKAQNFLGLLSKAPDARQIDLAKYTMQSGRKAILIVGDVKDGPQVVLPGPFSADRPSSFHLEIAPTVTKDNKVSYTLGGLYFQQLGEAGPTPKYIGLKFAKVDTLDDGSTTAIDIGTYDENNPTLPGGTQKRHAWAFITVELIMPGGALQTAAM